MTSALITGGAGFLGSHLSRRLLDEGWEVLCFDSLLTGRKANVSDLEERPGFRFEERDVTDGIEVQEPIDWVLHLASPASPPDYLAHPIATLEVGSLGTRNALELAKAKGASFFLASTSEVYGDPKEHPQTEAYWGNVNPIGPRSVYDEAKRFAEALTMAYRRTHDVPVRIARIFNTYGPGMRRDDGRAVPTFIVQALRGEPLTVHGTGEQTRSLCYVDDLVEGIYRLIQRPVDGPMNLGSTEEVSVLDIAQMVRELTGTRSEVRFVERPEDDPAMRKPDITLAGERLGWHPEIPIHEGLKRTVEWAREAWSEEGGSR